MNRNNIERLKVGDKVYMAREVHIFDEGDEVEIIKIDPDDWTVEISGKSTSIWVFIEDIQLNKPNT